MGSINRQPGLFHGVNKLNIRSLSWYHKWSTCSHSWCQ